MDYYAINALRENHAGWSLLRAQNAPLAISFFMAAFTGPNQRNLGRQQLIDSLDDVLFGLRDAWGKEPSPSRAALTRLTPEEAALYQALRDDRFGSAVRLEQELIGWDWALERLQ